MLAGSCAIVSSAARTRLSSVAVASSSSNTCLFHHHPPFTPHHTHAALQLPARPRVATLHEHPSQHEVVPAYARQQRLLRRQRQTEVDDALVLQRPRGLQRLRQLSRALLLAITVLSRRHQHAREGVGGEKRLQKGLQRLLGGQQRFESRAAAGTEEDRGGLVVGLAEEDAQRGGFRLAGQRLQ